MKEVYNLKKQAEIYDQILKQRLDTVLKEAMIKTDIDGWLIVSKEYAEDPVFKILTPASFLTARRITILFLYYDGNEIKKYCCNNSFEDLETIYTNIYKDYKKDQFECLNNFLLDLNPKKIAVNISKDYAYFDGLSKSFYDDLTTKLDQTISNKFVSSEDLGNIFFAKRGELERELYPYIMSIANDIIEEAFSDKVITVNKTTCDEVEWYIKERVKELKMDYWFSPDVNLQNNKSLNPMQNGDTVISYGDLVHVDFGITYLTLNTDTQRLLYILDKDETKIPQEIQEGYEENLRFHEIVCSCFKDNKSGNDILMEALEKAKKENIKAMLYTHPLGNFGHGPGPTIGLFSNQNKIYPAGEIKLEDNTSFALELNTRRYLPKYDKEIFFFTEESVIYHDGHIEYLSPLKKTIYVL